jgi:hypothetical protein
VNTLLHHSQCPLAPESEVWAGLTEAGNLPSNKHQLPGLAPSIV